MKKIKISKKYYKIVKKTTQNYLKCLNLKKKYKKKNNKFKNKKLTKKVKKVRKNK